MTSPDVPAADLTPPAKRGRVTFFDATGLHWCPDVGKRSVVQGDHRRVDSPGRANPCDARLGSLEYPTGAGLDTIHERKRHQEGQAHLERLLERAPDAFRIVVRDKASAHTTTPVAPFWEAHPDQWCPIFQPTYSPHVNLIERLWRFMRGQMTHHQCYASLKELAEAIIAWFEKLPCSQVCSLMGIHECPSHIC